MNGCFFQKIWLRNVNCFLSWHRKTLILGGFTLKPTERTFVPLKTVLKVCDGHTFMWQSFDILGQMEWGIQNGPITSNSFGGSKFCFFENLIWVQEPLTNS